MAPFHLPAPILAGSKGSFQLQLRGGPSLANTTGSTDIGLTIPGSAGIGDLMIAIAMQTESSIGVGTIDGPSTSGWTTLSSGTATSNTKLSIYYKFIESGEANPTMQFTQTSASVDNWAGLMAFTGAGTPSQGVLTGAVNTDPIVNNYSEPLESDIPESFEIIAMVGDQGLANLTFSVEPPGFKVLYTGLQPGIGSYSYRRNRERGATNWTGDMNQLTNHTLSRVRVPFGGPPPELVGVGTIAAANTAALSVSMPAGVQAGDLIVIVAGASTGTTLDISSVTTGYTKRIDGHNALAGGEEVLDIWTKTAGVSEGSATVNWTAGTNLKLAVALAYRNVATIVPAPAANVTTGAAQTHTTNTWNDDTFGIAIAAWLANNDGANNIDVATPPTGMTARALMDGNIHGGGGRPDLLVSVYDMPMSYRGTISRSQMVTAGAPNIAWISGGLELRTI
jgi:hypothetical protein